MFDLDRQNPPPPARGRWVTAVQLALLAVALALIAYALFAGQRRPARQVPSQRLAANGFARRGTRGFPPPDREIVKDFDKNGDGWLNQEERAAARESV